MVVSVLLNVTAPKVSVLLVPFKVMVRPPPAEAVPLAKLRSLVPPKLKLPFHATLFGVAMVNAEPLVLSMVPAEIDSAPEPIALA